MACGGGGSTPTDEPTSTPVIADRAGGIEVILTDLEGGPVAGLQVEIIGGTAAVPEITAETDDDGHYRFTGVPAGTFRVAVRDKDGQIVEWEKVNVGSGDTVTLSFSVPARGSAGKQGALPPLPVMRLRHAGQVYDGAEGSYCWPHSRTDDGSVVGLCADKIRWDGLSTAIPVEEGSSVTLEVEAEEQAQALSAGFYELDSGSMVRFVELGPGSKAALPVDLPEGLYNVAVFGHWPDGDLTHWFRIEVRPELSTTPPEPPIFFVRQEPAVGFQVVWDAELIGELVVEERCLRVNRSDADISYLPVWPPEFTLSIEADAVLILNGAGEVVASVGQDVRVSGGEVRSAERLDQRVREKLTAGCDGPYWIIGNEVGPAENAQGSAVTQTSVFFPKQAPVVGPREGMLALLTGQLVVVDGCLRVNDSVSSTSYLLVWPPEYTVHGEADPIQVLDGAGQVVSHVGEQVRVDGGDINSVLHLDERVRQSLPAVCPGPYWIVGDEVGPATEEATVPSGAQAGEEVPSGPLGEGEALLSDAQSYAADFGVGLDEAVRRLGLQDQIGELNAELAAKERDTFAGLWLEHTPQFQVVVLFTRSGEETIRSYIENGPLADIFAVRTAEATLAELENAQAAAVRAVRDLEIPVNSLTNVRENRVELWVTDPAQFHAALREANIRLPDHVQVVKVDTLASPESDGGSWRMAHPSY